jgi:hypothetical protein
MKLKCFEENEKLWGDGGEGSWLVLGCFKFQDVDAWEIQDK